MNWFATVTYIMFFLSVLIPVYTYAVYPLMLLFFREKQYESDDAFLPKVSILVLFDKDEHLTTDKLKCFHKLKYPNHEILSCDKVNADGITVIECEQARKTGELNALLNAAQGEIILVTDHKTLIDPLALKYLVRHFVDKRVGCVVGQLCSDNPSAFWKYENYVRQQEGKAGRVSGANGAIYAVRKELVEIVPESIINVDFYVSTLIQQKGYDVLFDSSAIAYEQPGEQADHVRDGTGYYQALRVFWRMLLPRKGSFVYWSHRVLKWLTPFCMIMALIASGLGMVRSPTMCIAFCLQIVGYIMLFVYRRYTKKHKHPLGWSIHRLLSIAIYFVELNVDWLIGAVLSTARWKDWV